MNINTKRAAVDSIAAVGGGLATFLFGAPDGVLYALIALVVLDYITGVLSAIVQKKLSSSVGFAGISKKLLVFIIVAVANILDVHVFTDSGFLRGAVIFFFIANEGLSILENAGNIGLPIPKKLLDVLEQLKNKDKEEEK